LEPTTFEFDAAGVRIAGLAYGDPARPPMVLVHGIRDHAGSFEPIARAFAEDYHVLAPDLRGHGDSDKPGSYAMAELVADLRALVRARGLARPVILGHSLGGQIAAHYAGLFDDVAALVCAEGLGPPRRAEDATPEGRRARLRGRTAQLLEAPAPREPLPDFVSALRRFCERNPRLDPERARRLVERGTEPVPGGGLRWKWAPDAQKVWSTVGMDDVEEIWSWIRCPVLVVTAADSASYWTRRGLSDALPADAFAADLERKLARFADAEHVVVDGAGHMLHYDQPDALVRAVRDFLKRRR
jgi:pimeloyl-ACP methyl ester carboxylesterase